MEHFVNYVVLVNQTMHQYPEWRRGQTYFNVLFDVRPDLAEMVRGTDHDPFYRDERINDFLSLILEHWDD